MTVTFEITIGKGENQYTKTVVIDPDEITLGFQEDLELAQESKRWRNLLPLLADILGLTHEEVRHITNKQFRAMAAALQNATTEAATVPNG